MGLTAYLYPGQSPQKAGLGKDLHHHHAQAREIYAAADAYLGTALSRLCFEGPEDKLNQDINCQMAVYTHSCAVSAILAAHERQADLVSGYSSGFYAAAYAAGCFGFVQGLEIVRLAGELLLRCAAEIDGAMGVVFGLDSAEVEDICRQSGQVHAAIYNTPRQIIISGLASDLQRALQKAREAGALDTYRLPAATAYHSALMQPAGEQLLAAIDPDTLRPPQRQLISYASLAPVNDAQGLVKAMAGQLSKPVRWAELIQGLGPAGIGRVYEVGPGRVIARSVRWIDRNLDVLALDDVAALEAVLEQAGA